MRNSCLLPASHLPSGHWGGHEEMAESWEDYPTFPLASWTALAKQKSPATYSERFKNGLSPSDES